MTYTEALTYHGYPLENVYQHPAEFGGNWRASAKISPNRTAMGFGKELNDALKALWNKIEKLPRRG